MGQQNNPVVRTCHDAAVTHGLDAADHCVRGKSQLSGGPESVRNRNQESVSVGSSSSPVSPASGLVLA